MKLHRDLGFNSLRIYLHDLLWNDRDSSTPFEHSFEYLRFPKNKTYSGSV